MTTIRKGVFGIAASTVLALTGAPNTAHARFAEPGTLSGAEHKSIISVDLSIDYPDANGRGGRMGSAGGGDAHINGPVGGGGVGGVGGTGGSGACSDDGNCVTGPHKPKAPVHVPPGPSAQP